MAALPAGLPSRADAPVRCDRCGLQAYVGKTSWQQTSLQWPDGGTVQCLELREPATDHSMIARVRTCSALARSINKATLAGAITIPE